MKVPASFTFILWSVHLLLLPAGWRCSPVQPAVERPTVAEARSNPTSVRPPRQELTSSRCKWMEKKCSCRKNGSRRHTAERCLKLCSKAFWPR
ncbi:unnamed protein product [Pleuronectes platessa]|uniref:Uncharacterized protein n=1 Tax=Pleuronectes platessa TaxID=8262 RepID=A0A9N7YB35_PLEPL|nr:unnamed protein product [Pleuronectes platessa]